MASMVRVGPFEYRQLQRHEVVNDARFITCSCVHRLPLFGNDRIKDAFERSLARACLRHHVRMIAWVLMPEHFHLLMVPDLPASPVRDVLNTVKSPLARRVIARWRHLRAPVLGRITEENGKAMFWQPGGGYDRNIHSEGELHEKFGYIHQNPVKRGLVAEPAAWRWSSARWYAGQRDGAVPIWDYPL